MAEKPTMIIRGGRVIDPSRNIDVLANVVVRGEFLDTITSKHIDADRVIDAAGLLVVPGLIDMHVHLREPGDEHKETIETGTAAAVAGGFSSVACMPNTRPPLDNPDTIRLVCRRAQDMGRCRVYPIACFTRHRAGEELVDFSKLVQAGAVAFSDDGDGLADSSLMSRAFETLARLQIPAIQHCEDPRFPRGVLHDGAVAKLLGLAGLSPLAEERMIARDLALCEIYGAQYHVAHISTSHSIELVRQAKAKGIRVTAEVCPHHLLLTDEACRSLDPNTKMHPPLRTRRDVDACIAGVVDGTIEVLVTDHAPHTPDEKNRGFSQAPAGVIGLETSLALFVKALIEPGHISWPRLVRMMSSAPAKILNVPGGTLMAGSRADLTLIDPNRLWSIDAAAFRSKSRNCPFHGTSVRGRAVCTIVNGVVQYEEGST